LFLVLIESKIDQLTEIVNNLKEMLHTVLKEVRKDVKPEDIVNRYADEFQAAVEPLGLPVSNANLLTSLNEQLENNILCVKVVSDYKKS
jgi:hypothetical protein